MSTKLYNADCFDIMRQMIKDNIKVDAIITDPPHNMTACSWDKQIDLFKFWTLVKRMRKDNANIVIFTKQPFTTLVNYSNLNEFRYEIIWQKQQATNPMCAKKRIMPIHENISVFYDKLGTYNPQMRYGFSNYSSFDDDTKKIGEIYDLKSKHRECKDGSRYPISVLNYNNVRKAVHPTQKPLELMEYLIKTYTNVGDVIFDPFMGSGTTGVAAVKCGRNFIGCELDNNYFNIAKERINEQI